LLPSKALENGTVKESFKINVSNVPVVFLEDAQGIRLEHNQARKPFSVSINLIIFVCH
jgi:hypothetical protein